MEIGMGMEYIITAIILYTMGSLLATRGKGKEYLSIRINRDMRAIGKKI